jgi:hypothetical protein
MEKTREQTYFSKVRAAIKKRGLTYGETYIRYLYSMSDSYIDKVTGMNKESLLGLAKEAYNDYDIEILTRKSMYS